MKVLILFLLCLSPASAQLSSEDHFTSGVKFMQEDKFAEAFNAFEAERQKNNESAPLLYNWGLSAYRLQKPGLAVAMWRRALYLDPELVAAANALEFANNEMPKTFSQADISFFTQLRVSLLDRISLNKLLFLSWLLLVASFALLIRFYASFKNAMQNSTDLPKIPTVAIILFALLIFSAAITLSKLIVASEVRATVTSNVATLRTGPNQDDNSIQDLLAGTDVLIVQTQNSWVLVSTMNGVSGWLPTEDLYQHTGRKTLW